MYTNICKFADYLLFRFKSFQYKNYKSSDIVECISMYYDIVRELVTAQNVEQVKLMFIDIEVFAKKFKYIVPEDLYNERLESLKMLQDVEFTKKIKGVKTQTILRCKPLGVVCL